MTQEEINYYHDLQQQIDVEKQEVETQELALRIAREELAKLEATIRKTEIDVNLESHNLRISQLQAEIQVINAKISDLNAQKAANQVRLDAAQAAKTQLTAAITAKKAELTAKNQELADLEAQPKSPERDEQIAIVKGQIAVLSRELETLEAEKRKIQTTIDVIKRTIDSIKAEIEAQKRKKAELVAEKTAVQAAFAESDALLDALNAQKTSKKAEITAIKAELNIAQQQLQAALVLYKPISDPRILVEALNDNTPFLLLPVRVETRFMTIKHVQRVNSIADIPTESRIPIPPQEQVKSKYDFGTVNFIEDETILNPLAIPRIKVDNSRALLDKHELWVRIIPDDIALHTHEERLTADEELAGQTYWNERWSVDPISSDYENVHLGAWRVLCESYGPERAAWITNQTEPTNVLSPPFPATPVFPVLSIKPASWTEQPRSKVMPDRFVVRIYPTGGNYREVLGKLIPDPLPVGINPTPADLDDDAFDALGTKMKFPKEIDWLTDFEEAEKIGMAIRIPLSGTEPFTGFDKIFVLGLKLSANKTKSKALLEELINNHHYKSGGFSLLPQGTPTNNTEESTSGYESHETGYEESFATETQEELFTPTTDRFNKTDGQWFSEMLGISPATMQHIRYADRYDQREEMAMNTALWPATMGYYIKQMLTPLVFSAAHNDTRQFFTDHASARGRIPSFRVDNQPYGVIISTAFSKWKFSTQPGKKVSNVLKNMFEKVLLPVNNEFDKMVDHVIHAGSVGDVQKNFLEMLGLHASSVEFHQRFASGQYFSWNLLKYFENAPGQPPPSTDFLEMTNAIPNSLKDLYQDTTGFNLGINPRILQMLFVANQRLLNGPVIDLQVLPYSETRGIQSFPSTIVNYVEWLLMSDVTRIREENFDNIPDVIAGQKPPKALLYLLLRHGYLLEYVNTATQILVNGSEIQEEAQIEFELPKTIDQVEMSVEEKQLITNLVTAEVVLDFEMKLEKQLDQQELKGIIKKSSRESTKEKIRAQEAKNVEAVAKTAIANRIELYTAEQTKWNYLTNAYPAITGELSMLEHITAQLSAGSTDTAYLAKITEALEILKDLPTARLERCLAESLDLCNYRLDGWLLGLANQRVERQLQDQRTAGTEGSYIGAFGMVENLKPNTSFPGISVVESADAGVDENSPHFIYLGLDPLTVLEYDNEENEIVAPPRVNNENLGFIHAPSMNHAVAAAILRAGYGGHEGTASPEDALAINLRSDRVRKALFYMEGIRNGQDLAALLGYQFERALHDLDLGLDEFILDIRRKYPMIANGVTPEDPSEIGVSIEAFEGRNVVDGLKLIEAYRENPTTWQTGTGIPDPSSQLNHINAQITEITNHMDALSDLMMAESMYQVATGNHERAGAVIKALGEGNIIPDPQIIKTPRFDKVMMQRHAVLFDTTISLPLAWSGAESPRSFSEPALNNWLKINLPDPEKVIINYEYTLVDLAGNETIVADKVALNDFGLQPIDFIYMMKDQGQAEDGSQLSALINYVTLHTVSQNEIPVKLKFIDRTGLDPDEITIFELLPLVRSLQDMIGQGRPMKPDDFLLEGEVYDIKQSAAPGEGLDLTNVEARLLEAYGPATTAGRKGLVDIITELTTAMNNANGITTITGNETLLDNLRDALMAANNFAVSGSVPESAYTYSLEARDTLSNQATRILSQLGAISGKTNTLYGELATLTDLDQRLEKLQEIAQALFGRDFKVFPEFNFYNKTDIDLSRSNPNLLAEAGDFAIDEWLHGIAKVRPKMANYHLSSMVSESLADHTALREVIQLPIVSNLDDRWLSATLPDGYSIPEQAISLVLDLPESYVTCNLQSGFILDEWNESIPESNAVTGVSFNYDQPDCEAPNALILAVSPEEKGKWLWTDLMDTLDETLQMAKKRAVDPDILNANSPLGHALPAIVASVEASDSAPGLDFARNVVGVTSGQVGPINLQEFISL
jgi:hypothetical protein